MNIVIKIGRLTSDPELRYTNSGKAVVNFNIATRKKFKHEGQRDVDFFKCTAWNKAADFIANNIKKGGRIAIAGRTENNNYENQQGQIIRYDEIIIEDFEIIDFANSKGNESSDFPNTSNTFGSNNQIDVKDEDLPF